MYLLVPSLLPPKLRLTEHTHTFRTISDGTDYTSTKARTLYTPTAALLAAPLQRPSVAYGSSSYVWP